MGTGKRWPNYAEDHRVASLAEARNIQRELELLSAWLIKKEYFRALAVVDSCIKRSKNVEIAMLRAKLGLPYYDDQAQLEEAEQ